MNADKAILADADLTDRIIGAFYAVYNELGHGFLESVYGNALLIALQDAGLTVEARKCLTVEYRSHVVGGFKADLLVAEKIIVEIKAVSHLLPAHEAQLVNYLKASGLHVGLLLNFGPRPQFKRKVFGQSQLDPLSSDLIRV